MSIDQQILDAFLEKVEAVVKLSIADMKTDIADMKTDITDMKIDITDMKIDITDMKSDISVMKSTLREHTDLLHALEHRTEENTAQLLQISEDVSYLKGTVANHGQEITELKTLRSEDRRIIEAMSAMVIKHESQLKTIGVK